MAGGRNELIEVALPLEAVNKASARERSHSYRSTLHLRWVHWPLAAAQPVIFTRMVEDPSANPDPFQREPDFGVTIVNCGFAELFARAEVPR